MTFDHWQGSPEHHTLVPLLILLAQQMQIIAASHTSSQLKFIAELSDKCQQTLYQVRPLQHPSQSHHPGFMTVLCSQLYWSHGQPVIILNMKPK